MSTVQPALSRARDVATMDPVPVLLLRRGPVGMRSLTALHEDQRLELFVADELTPEWIAMAKRMAGVLVATEGDPLSAFGYAVTGGLTNPIVVTMARRFRNHRDDLLAAGAAGCLLMPVSGADLDSIVPLLTSQSGASRIDTTLRLLLDPVGLVARYHDKSVRLSQREFAVLHCMSSHRGRPVSAEELLTYVWGDSQSSDRTRQILDVYIFQLRKKLDRLGLEGAIATIRGFGYALVQVMANARH